MNRSHAVLQSRALDPVCQLRHLAVLGLSLIVGLAMATLVRAQDEMVVSHGYSFYGDLTYPADFENFNYVNPDAPKGGEISFAALGTFDSMNPYTVKGRAGRLASMMYESLLGDGPADTYGEGYGLLGAGRRRRAYSRPVPKRRWH